jgi:hypothetical protein
MFHQHFTGPPFADEPLERLHLFERQHKAGQPADRLPALDVAAGW